MLLHELVFLEHIQNHVHILVEIIIFLKVLLNEQTEPSALKELWLVPPISEYLLFLNDKVAGSRETEVIKPQSLLWRL